MSVPIFKCVSCGCLQSVEDMCCELAEHRGAVVAYFSCKSCGGNHFQKTSGKKRIELAKPGET